MVGEDGFMWSPKADASITSTSNWMLASGFESGWMRNWNVLQVGQLGGNRVSLERRLQWLKEGWLWRQQGRLKMACYVFLLGSQT